MPPGVDATRGRCHPGSMVQIVESPKENKARGSVLFGER
jgi:hypothetical protein